MRLDLETAVTDHTWFAQLHDIDTIYTYTHAISILRMGMRDHAMITMSFDHGTYDDEIDVISVWLIAPVAMVSDWRLGQG